VSAPRDIQSDLFAALLTNPVPFLREDPVFDRASESARDPLHVVDPHDGGDPNEADDARDPLDGVQAALDAALDAALAADPADQFAAVGDDDVIAVGPVVLVDEMEADGVLEIDDDEDAADPSARVRAFDPVEDADDDADHERDTPTIATSAADAAADAVWATAVARDPNWMSDAIRAWKGGDERALDPVVVHYRRVFSRDARVSSAIRLRENPLDASDVESAGMEQLVKALGRFDPEAGVPFPGFFKMFRRAAINAERAAFLGPMRLSRRTLTERGHVFRAIAVVRAERAGHRSATPLPVQPIPFTLSSSFTAADATALATGTRGTRLAALHKLFDDILAHMTRAVTEFVPRTVMVGETAVELFDPMLRLDDAALRQLTAQAIDDLRPATWPTTRRDLETMIVPRVAAFVERVRRDGVAAGLPATTDDASFITAVAAKAGISEAQVRLHLRLDVHGTSLDAPIEGKGGKDAGSVGDRIEAPEHTIGGNALRAKAIKLMPFLSPPARTILVLLTGLDGRRPVGQDEIALGLGLVRRRVELFVSEIEATLRHPEVVRQLHGDDAARVATEAESRTLFRTARSAFLANRVADATADECAPTPRVTDVRTASREPAIAVAGPNLELFAH
jgi:DNA-directed RNA polymerase sigma subunit (sigma70/sigma32)